MKKVLVITLLLSFSFLHGQELSEQDVPESVRSAFEKMFSGVKPESWEKERYGLYEAEFRKDGRRASATFNANGLLMRNEVELKTSEMPKEVIAHTRKLYPAYKVGECARISEPDGKKLFEVEIVKGSERKSLIFSENNEYLREEVDEDDDDMNVKKQ